MLIFGKLFYIYKLIHIDLNPKTLRGSFLLVPLLNNIIHMSLASHICDMYAYALFKPYFLAKLASFCFLIVKHTLNLLFT